MSVFVVWLLTCFLTLMISGALYQVVSGWTYDRTADRHVDQMLYLVWVLSIVDALAGTFVRKLKTQKNEECEPTATGQRRTGTSASML